MIKISSHNNQKLKTAWFLKDNIFFYPEKNNYGVVNLTVWLAAFANICQCKGSVGL